MALVIALLGLIAGAIRQADAQNYPDMTVRYLVAMSPGSRANTIGGIVASRMAQAWGRQVILDNRTGAAGNLGADAAACLAADGYTVFQVSIMHVAIATLERKLTSDLARDFTAVTQRTSSLSMLVVHRSLPVKSVAELEKLARTRPGEMNYPFTGSGSATSLTAELFENMAQVNIVHMP